MQLWMIERDVTGWSDEDLDAAGLRAKMCLGWYPDVFWDRSYIDRARSLVTCVYRATSEEALREHARAAALPVTALFHVEEYEPSDTPLEPGPNGLSAVATEVADSLPLWMINRDVAGWNDEDLEAAHIRAMLCEGWLPGIHWVRSYLGRDIGRLVCMYLAEDEPTIQAHTTGASLPLTDARKVEEVTPDDIGVIPADEASRYAVSVGLPPTPVR